MASYNSQNPAKIDSHNGSRMWEEEKEREINGPHHDGSTEKNGITNNNGKQESEGVLTKIKNALAGNKGSSSKDQKKKMSQEERQRKQIMKKGYHHTSHQEFDQDYGGTTFHVTSSRTMKITPPKKSWF